MKLDLKEALGTWYPVLSHLFQDSKMEYIGRVLGATENNLQPKLEYIFRAFQLCSIKNLKVLIMGQDPYPYGEADGLAFSSKFKSRPYSLQIIFEELEREGFQSRSTNGLDDWAEQGVLLLNASLTTVTNKIGAHTNIGWDWFVGEVLYKIAIEYQNRWPLVVMEWGADAKKIIRTKFAPYCGSAAILHAPHPAAQRHGYKFLGCGHFKLANEYLISHNKEPIVWT